MRLFTAVDLPAAMLDSLELLLERLRPTAPIQWSPLANLHITTKFIGEWPEPRLSELTAALAAIAPREPICIHVRKLGFFPNPHSPRIFWVGIESPRLPALASDTDRATAALGIEPEKRAYTPHLTLARIKGSGSLFPLQNAIAALGQPDLGSFEARSFFLYLSQMQRGGSVYTKLAEFPLSRP